MSNVTWTDDGALADLDAMRAVLNAGSVALFQNNFIPDHASVPADFTECSFTGYSRETGPAFAAAFLNNDGKAESDSRTLAWRFTAGAGSTKVYGWYLLSAGDASVLMFCKFLDLIFLTPGSPNLDRVIEATAVSEL